MQFMLKYLCRFAFFTLLTCLPASLAAQSPPKPADNKPADSKGDYSKDAFVDEDDVTKIVFENDGTGTRDSSVRIRIQSDAGVQRYGVLTFSYQQAVETVDIDYVRVRKPDGTVVVTPADNIQDMPSDITRQAPFYSDLHEKHVAVKGLAVGDLLEAHTVWHVTKPLAPGQFWYAYNFSRDAIMLHEEVQMSVPRNRPVKWKSPNVKPVITEEGTRRVFTWTRSQLEHKSADEEKKDQEEKVYQAARGKLPSPEVELSSFQSWEEIGAWYNKLQLERVAPSAEVRAKAAELTRNATDENAKLHAIYSYVGTQFRYIGVAFGIGRYQPHSAADVLSNGYGDCKDKHTLLASLLDAAGIKAYPALINSSRDFDPDVPSPGQFDHVITAVPQGNSYTWLDSTAEVAPFAYLLSVLRDKPALVIPPDRPASLIKTLAEPPSPRLETFKIEAKLDDTGTLQGKVDRSIRGDDAEVLLRMAFRRVPLTQWKELAQQISYGSGFSGEVSDATASSPEKTDEAFHWSYSYNRKDFPQWSERRINSPIPPLLAAAPDEKPDHPILLGELGKSEYLSQVELPKGYSPQLPAQVNLKEDFAEYHAAYTVNKGVLQTERELVVKMHEVPLAQYDAYKKFAKAVADDRDLYVALSSGTSEASAASQWQNAIWSLPASDNAQAMRSSDAALADARSGDMPGAIAALNQALTADPQYARAWMLLASLYVTTGQREKALDTLRKASQAVPNQPTVYRALVTSLMEMHQYEEAVSVLQNLAKNDPSNVDILSTLGGALSQLKRYSEAATVVESAVKLAPDRAGLHYQLGMAYLHADSDERAVAAFKKALEIDPSPMMFNNIGYYMADANKQLPLSLEYAQRAVHDEEEASAKVKLADLKKEDLQYTRSLAPYWDTLGWVYFQMGAYDKVEKYLNASWVLAQDPTVADHLGQFYEQQRKKEAAIRMYRLALAASRAPDEMKETKSRLEHLGGALRAGRLGQSASEELSKMRSFRLERVTSETATAEFFLLFARDGKIEDAKFVSGSEKLKAASKVIRAAAFKVPVPDDVPIHLVRRGVLGCYKVTGCTFVLYSPNDVHSVD